MSTSEQNPWDWMQPHDVERFGDVIGIPAEQARWCHAVALGGLPYMWRLKAAVVRETMYDRMALRPGDRVLILGESIASCGFVDDIRARIGADGTIDVIDITDEARDAYFAGRRGRHGQLATWRYDYTRTIPDEAYDVVAVLQGVQHAEDWRETGTELLRIMRPGRTIMLAEITFSPQMVMKAQLDLHIEYWIEKLFSRLGWPIDQFPYYSPEDLVASFSGLVTDPNTFSWKGVELFWGTKAVGGAAHPGAWRDRRSRTGVGRTLAALSSSSHVGFRGGTGRARRVAPSCRRSPPRGSNASKQIRTVPLDPCVDLAARAGEDDARSTRCLSGARRTSTMERCDRVRGRASETSVRRGMDRRRSTPAVWPSK